MVSDIMPIVTAGMRVAEVASAVCIFGAISEGSDLSVAAAIISVGAIVVPRFIDWYKAGAAARRAEHAADLQLDSEILAAEIRKRVELESKCASLSEQASQNRHKLAGQEQTIMNLKAQLDKLAGTVEVIGAQAQTQARLATPDPDLQVRK